jgi:hypothetical protein
MAPADLNRDGVEMVPLHGIEGALSAFRAAGGVVDYCMMWISPAVEEERGRRIAVATMVDQAAMRHAAFVRASGGTQRIKHRNDVQNATCELIAPEEFVGPHYDWSTHRLISPWANGMKLGTPDGQMTFGYADAFSDPPYRIAAPLEKVSAWFDAINKGTFGGLDKNLIVHRWSTDWSDYFEPGHEWWGSYCWTIQRTGSPFVVAIGASSTD